MFSQEDFFSIDDFTYLWKVNGFLWDPLILMSEYLKKHSHKIEIQVPNDVFLKNPELISIGKGTVIEPSVMIEGPCIIGKNSTIRHGAYLRGNVIIGDNCVVGHCCELKNSLLMNRAVAAHLCYVGDSILGPEVNLGAGVKCSNLRLDRREIGVKFQEKIVNTGLVKLGAILGKGVQIGCNCVLNPGTFVGRESFVYPLMNIGGYIPAGVQVRASQNWVVEAKAEKILQNLRNHV